MTNSDQRDHEVGRVVLALADLAPRGKPRTDHDKVDAPLLWLGSSGEALFAHGPVPIVELGTSEAVRRIAALDRLNPQDRLLSVGWAWAVGTVVESKPSADGTPPMGVHTRRIATPLLSIPVRIRGHFVTFRAEPAGDARITPFVTDRSAAQRLEASAQFGGGALASVANEALIKRLPNLRRWVESVASAAGFPVPKLAGGWLNPLDHVDDQQFTVVLGYGLYRPRLTVPDDIATTLRSWPVKGLGETAFASLYLPREQETLDDETRVLSPSPLTSAQSRAVLRSRTAPVSVVSGAPGNGKTHTAVAAAIDAVQRGQHVLVATRSFFAAEVIAEQLHKHPGPPPVVFGSMERRAALVRELSSGAGTGPEAAVLEARRADVQRDVRDVDARRAALRRLLRAERDAEATVPEASIAGLDRVEMPGLFASDSNLAACERLAADALSPRTGWRARRRGIRAETELRRLAGANGDHTVEDIADAIVVARHLQVAAALLSGGGPDYDRLLADLGASEQRMRLSIGALIEDQARAARCQGTAERRAVAALARALRAGRAARRELLAQLSASRLLDALPLWIGTLGDIDDLLPLAPGLFDLVILDEASQIDQIQAAPALLRGRRALVVGDPQQLRHVSFVSDDDVQGAVKQAGVGHLMDRLDLRRVSAFDAAAAIAPVEWLDEHHRSVPHLIEFSAQRFYPDAIRLVTRHPRNECIDAIDVMRVAGHNDGNVNAGEVVAVEAMLRDFLRGGVSGVGVITPFRPQADALEAAVLDHFSVEEIDRLDLRVSTVHAFQGDERPRMVLSLVLDDDTLKASRRFVEDPHLFNVMVTRARDRVAVVTSLTGDPGGLIGAYLENADRAPQPMRAGAPTSAWASELGEELTRAGLLTRTSYPVGRWTVDLCVGTGTDAVGVITTAHVDGPDAHIRRHLELSAAGWQLIHAFETTWAGDAPRAAIELHRWVTTDRVRRHE